MARPNWEYVRVDVLLPDHPKLDGLSYAAKWTLIELWCWCGKNTTDGFVRDAKWKTFGPSSARTALVKAGLAERGRGGYRMHDYLDHQRSLEEIEAVRAKRSAAGKASAEARAKAKALAEQDAEHGAEQDAPADEAEILTGNTSSHPGTDPGSDRVSELSTGPFEAPQNARRPGQATNGLQQGVQQTRSKPATEAEAEAEAEVLMAEVDQSSIRGLTPEESMISMIVWEIYQATSRTITDGQAAAVRDSILAGRSPDDPHAYVSSAIRKELDPRARWLHAASDLPSARTPTEAAFDAGIVPNGRPLDDQAVAAIAAQTRKALRRDT